MLNVVTISYLFALQAISPLNGFIIYPYKLFLLTELFINNASLAQINNYALPLPSLLFRPLSSGNFFLGSLLRFAAICCNLLQTVRSRWVDMVVSDLRKTRILQQNCSIL